MSEIQSIDNRKSYPELENIILPDKLECHLQACLMYMAAYYRRTHSLESLTNGLPIQNDKLTFQLYVRATRRAGLDAMVTERKAKDISPHVLPCVVSMKGDKHLILQEITPTGEFVVVDVINKATTTYEDYSAFAKDFTGYLVLTRESNTFSMLSDTFKTGGEWFWGTVKQFKNIYIQVACAAVIINLMALVSPLYVMNVYDRVLPNENYYTLAVLSIGVITVFLFDFIFRQLRAYFIDIAGKGADILLASRLYEQVLNIRLGQRASSAGAFANQLREFETLRDFFTSSTLVAFIDLPFVLIFIAVIASIAGPVALVPLVAGIIILAVVYFIQLPLRQLVEQSNKDLDAKHGHLIETINGIETIKSLGTQSYVQHKWEQYVGTSAKLGVRTRFQSQLGLHFSVFMQQAVTVGVVVFGVLRIHAGDMSMGALIASTLLSGRALAPLGQAVGLFVRLQQSQSSLHSLDSIMQMEVERPEAKNYVHVRNLKGDIRFEDVSFQYPQAQINSLHNISFSIKQGEKVAIVGRAGSGKSTLSRLVLNLYNPTSGSILLDNLDIRQLDPAEIRQQISYVPQNVVLFRGTMRDNLLFANPKATDEDIQKAAELSGIYEFIRRHPMGYDMPIGEMGSTLSGGQRQSVAIARGLLRDGSVVIMDDPTSELDNRSEEHVKRTFANWVQDKTMILITHRATMLDLVDRLIVIDYGRILLDGPKDKVLKQLQGGGAPTNG